SRELLEMLVQQPRMVDGGLQDERLASWNGGAVAAVKGARWPVRACPHIGLTTRNRANGGRALARRGWLSSPVHHSPLAIRHAAARRPRLRPSIAVEQAPQPILEFAPIVLAHGIVADRSGDLRDACFER